MTDLIEKVIRAMSDATPDEPVHMHRPVRVRKAKARAAIEAVLDDLESPDEHMLEAFWRRFDRGPDPESFNTLLGDALAAAFRAKRAQLGLSSPEKPAQHMQGDYEAQGLVGAQERLSGREKV